MDLNQLLKGVKGVVAETAQFIRTERIQFSHEATQVKGLNDLVSYVDKTSEEKLVQGLLQLLPESGFLAEEGTQAGLKEWNWIIDPLDGTTNFVHGIPCYAISVGLEHKGEIVLGVVHEVARDEQFCAIKNGGAYLNEKAIRVSATKRLQDSLIATGFPVNNFDQMQGVLNALEHFMRHTHGIRRIGAAAADLCYLACGRVDAFYEYNLKPWDVAAGALIAKEAGAIVTDFNGGAGWLHGRTIMASNPTLFEVFSAVIQTSFTNLS